MTIDLGILEQYAPVLGEALWFTVLISVVSIFGSLIPGCVFALMTRSNNRTVRWLGESLIALGRNIPSIMQLFIVFYVLPIALDISIPAFWAAAISFAFNGSGYVAAIVQTGLGGVPRGQWEAARSLGIRGWRLYRRVIGPQALVVTVAPFMNELTRQVKSSSIAAAVAVPELVYAATSVSSETFDPFTVLTAVAVLYFVILFPLSMLSRRIPNPI